MRPGRLWGILYISPCHQLLPSGNVAALHLSSVAANIKLRAATWCRWLSNRSRAAHLLGC